MACDQSSGVAVYATQTDLDGVCETPLAPREPLCNPEFELGVSGAYTVIDSANRFVVGRTRFV